MTEKKPDFFIGVGHSLHGVSLHIKHPVTGEDVPLFIIEPEFARTIAQNLTIASMEVEDLRKKSSGG